MSEITPITMRDRAIRAMMNDGDRREEPTTTTSSIRTGKNRTKSNTAPTKNGSRASVMGWMPRCALVEQHVLENQVGPVSSRHTPAIQNRGPQSGIARRRSCAMTRPRPRYRFVMSAGRSGVFLVRDLRPCSRPHRLRQTAPPFIAELSNSIGRANRPRKMRSAGVPSVGDFEIRGRARGVPPTRHAPRGAPDWRPSKSGSRDRRRWWWSASAAHRSVSGSGMRRSSRFADASTTETCRRGEALAVHPDVRGDDPVGLLHRRVEAQELFDGGGDQAGLSAKSRR